MSNNYYFVFHPILSKRFLSKGKVDASDILHCPWPRIDKLSHLLQACRLAGGVKRVVLTSSVAAISGGFDDGGKYTEEDWTDITQPKLMPYIKSKVSSKEAYLGCNDDKNPTSRLP